MCRSWLRRGSENDPGAIGFRDHCLAYSQAIADPSIMDDPSQRAQPHHAAFNDISYRINGGWNKVYA